MNKNLVIVRAGDQSLHTQWLDPKISRNWDIVVSYFGNQEVPYAGQYDYLHRFKGSKWQGIADFCLHNQKLINQYDYIWLPDDDLLTNADNINHYFDLCREYDLTLSQPALLISSYISHHITLQHAFCQWRKTNFVEIMAPCFRKDFFNLVKHTFSINSSGWGLEWLWQDIAIRNRLYNFALVDATPIFHSRPVNISQSGGGGATSAPEKEMQQLFIENGIERKPMRNLAYYPSRFWLTRLFSSMHFLFTRFMYFSYKNKKQFNRQ